MLVSSHGWFCVHHILHLYGKLLCLVHLTMSTGVITKTILPKAYRSGVSHLQVCSISSHLLISFAWTMSWGPRFLHSRDNAFGMPTMVSGIWCGVSIPYMVSWGGGMGTREGRWGGSHCSHLQSQDFNKPQWFSRGHQDSAKLPFCVPVPPWDLWALYGLIV